ncbi:sugar lactone lactonase YvrE [Kribbella amoyensis]|uniref:Sugar lactone lactonase YvrE n=1 Tax=Kribbella amoyensis TaxID=996641 RepID=A0A561BS94_9ACTN|nr:SMP-30/gluconolactonase/LRE family protein [Kribbella amoyensis]TWD81751.1 sugar lactone lactonase YvrE [Kribbella amoyensis]
MRAEQITAADAAHGEGPVWWPGWGGLRWVDMLVGDLLHLDERTGEVARHHVGKVAAMIRPRASGGMILAGEHTIQVTDEPAGPATTIATPLSDPAVRFNEGGCDPHGRFYVGSMAYDESPGRGVLLRVDQDHQVETVLTGVTISNGLAWSPDGSRAYYADSTTHQIDSFAYDEDAGLHDRKTFVRIPAEQGVPDGLTVDAEGGIWAALWEGGAVHRYSPAGELDQVVELPAAKVTACTFGGDQLDRLYITTSRHGETSPVPSAGAVFAVEPGVRGLPTLPYAG